MPKKKPNFAVIGILLWWYSANTAAATLPQPNLYEFTGHEVQISYSTSSITGDPLLSYRDAQHTLGFSGDEIRVVASAIGQQVSVTLEQIPDLQTITLTLLIPDIHLDKDVVLFKTVAITTTHKTSIAGPDLVSGVVQSYHTMAVRGQASQVSFLQGADTAVLGEVTLSPTCPGPQRPGQVCVAPYVDAAVQIFDTRSVIVATAKTNALGLFKANVPQGSYRVHIDGNAIWPRCPDVPVTVPPENYASVSVNCDTGIR